VGLSLIRQTARAVAWNQAAKVVEVATGFGVSVLLARLLAKEAYGVYGLAFAVVGMLLLAADLGLKETFGKFLPQVGSAARVRFIVRRFLAVRVAMLVVLAASLWGGASLLGRIGLGDLSPCVPLMVLVLAGRSLFSLFEAYSLATLRVRALALVRIAQSLLWVVSLLGLLTWDRWGLWPVLAAHAAGLLVATVALGVADRRALIGPTEAAPLAPMVWFGVAVWATLLVNVGVEHGIDAVLIGALAGDVAEVARYSVGIYPAVRLFAFIVFAFSTVCLPSLSAAQARGGMAALAAARAGYVKLMAGVVVPVFAFLFVLAPEITTGLYGRAYASSAVVLRVMCLALMVVALVGGGVNANTLLALGRAKVFFWSRLAAGAVNVAADVLLIPPLGALGAVTATASVIVGLHLFDLVMVHVLSGARLPERFLSRVSGATVGAIVVLSLCPAGSLWHIGAAAAGYFLLSACLWVIARPLDWSDRLHLAKVHPALGWLAGAFAARPP